MPPQNYSSAEIASHPVLFFDGACNLCNSFVQFVIRHDQQKRFLFAPLQSDAGKKALADASNGNFTVPDTVILLYKGRYLIKSSAALTVLKLSGGLNKLLYAGIIVPRFMRDWVYDFVARNRYKWFGKRDTCMIPTPEIMERFIS